MNKIKEQGEIYDLFLRSLRKYKRAFTMHCHPNLWQDHAEAYQEVNVDAFKAYVEGSHANTNRLGELWDCLREYCNLWSISPICLENRYNRQSVTKFMPRKDFRHSGHSQYEEYIKNIGRHLANREDFLYEWDSMYKISVFGTLGADGIYRAHVNFARHITPQVDVYYLISEKTAIFMEED